MLRIEDFPQAKVDKFGDMFIQILNKFSDDNNLKKDDFPDIEVQYQVYCFIVI